MPIHVNEWKLNLPDLNHRIQNEEFYDFLESENIDEDEFFDSLVLKETIINNADNITLSMYTWEVFYQSNSAPTNFKEFAKIMFYVITNPKIENLFDYTDINNLNQSLVNSINKELSNYRMYIYIGNLYIESKFRKIGLMNYFVSTLLNKFERIEYICFIHYGTMGEHTVDDLLLKRCYQMYGFRPDNFWQTVHETTSGEKCDNLLIRVNEIE
jgi:hypothetical protein